MQGAGIGLPTVWLVTAFCGAMWIVGGLGHGTKNVLARTLIQERVPDRLHGRAFAAYNGLRNGAELFALAAGGALVALVGARTTLAIAGGVSVAAGLVGLALLRRAGCRRTTEPPREARGARPGGVDQLTGRVNQPVSESSLLSVWKAARIAILAAFVSD